MNGIDSPSAAEFWLRPGADCADDVERLIASHGDRVGLDDLLLPGGLTRSPGGRACRGHRVGGLVRWSSLSRPEGVSRAARARPPAPAASYGFRWRLWDCLTLRWWPQGITTSADASETGLVGGREVVVVSWYAKRFRGRNLGARLSFVDVTDRNRPTYRHVLLVEPVSDVRPGAVQPRPVHVHAGGIAWHGSTIWVADTYGGFRLFDVNNLLKVGGAGIEGYAYVLPQRSAYHAVASEGTKRFRFSFVSLDRSGRVPCLVTGEYGGSGAARRLARFRLDPGSGGLALADGVARPVVVSPDGPQRMQGAVSVDGRDYLATSNGRWHRGTLWRRQGGQAPEECGPLLAVGPEDLAYWRHRDELWNVTEHPLRRYVYAVPRRQFDWSEGSRHA